MTYSNQDIAPKPYVQVSFPKESPILSHPAGHDRYQRDLFHGTLHLTLEVQTSLHVSTGVVAMGSDSDVGSKIPLIKTMTQTLSVTGAKQLAIQGSSLKGCLRSIYEAITNSTLAVMSGRDKLKIPQERHPCKKKEELCPASRVFGAMDWQGLVSFSDASCQITQPSVGFMPSLYRPRPERPGYYGANGKVLGRKFYYNMTQSIDKGKQGIPVQQAGRSYTFDTVLNYRNLLPAELGIILIALGQDPKYPIALKLGGGKPIGMGTMTVTVTEIDRSADVRDRYREYNLDRHIQLTGSDLDRFIQQQIQAAHGSKLLQQTQLAELTQVLKYPSDRQPPSGMY
jgi:RAMP superfamily